MNKYLAKLASLTSSTNNKSNLKDVLDTGVIAGLGGVGGMVANKIMKVKGAFSPKNFAIGTGVGLLADYAGVKLNKHINSHLGSLQTKQASTALSRRVNNSPSLTVTTDGNIENSAVKAFAGSSKNNLKKGINFSTAVDAGIRARNRTTGVSSRFLNESLTGERPKGFQGPRDVLETSNIRDRLAKHRQNLGLAKPQTKKDEISNALIIREKKPTINEGLQSKKPSGVLNRTLKNLGFKSSKPGLTPNNTENAANINLALRDSIRNHQVSLDFKGKASKVVSSAPTIARPNKFLTALKSPLGKKLMVGTALVGTGAYLHSKIQKRRDESNYGYSY